MGVILSYVCVMFSFHLLDYIVAHMAELSWHYFMTNTICTYMGSRQCPKRVILKENVSPDGKRPGKYGNVVSLYSIDTLERVPGMAMVAYNMRLGTVTGARMVAIWGTA